jgi:hypothetical protein
MIPVTHTVSKWKSKNIFSIMLLCVYCVNVKIIVTQIFVLPIIAKIYRKENKLLVFADFVQMFFL